MHGNQINKLPVNYFFGLNVNRSSALELQGYTIKDIQAATQWCSQEKVFRKYAANLQEKTHAEVRFQ